MIPPSVKGGVAATLLLLLTLMGCGPRPTEDVQARVDGSHLAIANHTGADIHLQLLQGPVAWVPLSTPVNRLPDGQDKRLRIAPSLRGTSIDVAWWRPGAKVGNSDIRGADRVRHIIVELPPADEASTDEALVRTCIRLAALTPPGQGRNRAGTRVEEDCMKLADDGCTSQGLCERQLAQKQDELARAEANVARQAAASTPGPSRGVAAAYMLTVAREAFADLREGKVDRYVARLCPALREGYAGTFMQGLLRQTGEAFAARKLDLAKVDEQDADHVVFIAIDDAIRTGRSPIQAGVRIQARFQNDGDRPCLAEVAELR